MVCMAPKMYCTHELIRLAFSRCVCRSLAEKASKGGAGAGQKLGGSSAEAAPADANDMRAKMAAAAEARLKAMGQ